MQNFEMPKPTEKHAKLQSLAGTWVGEETMYPSPWDPKGGPALGRTESRLDLDGFYLLSDYTQERGGRTSYKGHGVFGYDPGSGSYTMHWFDSMGFPCTVPAKGTRPETGARSSKPRRPSRRDHRCSRPPRPRTGSWGQSERSR